MIALVANLTKTSPSIHYLGRQYRTSQFQNGAAVLSQSNILEFRCTVSFAARRRHSSAPSLPTVSGPGPAFRRVMTDSVIPNMACQSEHFGSTRRGASAIARPPASGQDSMSRSEHLGFSSNRGANVSGTAANMMLQAVNKVIGQPQETPTRLQLAVNHWGYTNQDVLRVVDDE